MDVVTHSMAGLLIGGTAARKKDNLYAVLLTAALASALIDVLDVWLYLVDVELYRRYHRVYTHTLYGAPFFALLGALPAWLWVKGRWLFLYLVSLVSILVHLGMDVLCDWPLLLFYPFSDRDFALYWVTYSNIPLLIILTVLSLGVIYYRYNRE